MREPFNMTQNEIWDMHWPVFANLLNEGKASKPGVKTFGSMEAYLASDEYKQAMKEGR